MLLEGDGEGTLGDGMSDVEYLRGGSRRGRQAMGMGFDFGDRTRMG